MKENEAWSSRVNTGLSMSKDLQKRLRQLRTAEMQTKPDQAWLKATRKTLLMQVENTLPTNHGLPVAAQLKETVRYALPQGFVRWISRPAMAALTLITILAGGSVVSVSAAEQSMPGDLLYGLKLATEQARLALTTAKGEKLKLKTEFTTRRLEELKKVVANDKQSEKVVQVTEILKRDMNTLKEQLTDMAKEEPADKTAEAAKLVDRKSNEVISALKDTKEDLPAKSKEKVTEAQSVAADAGVKALEVMVEKHQEGNELVPVDEIVQAIQDHAKVVAEATSASALVVEATTGTSSAASTTASNSSATSTASTTSESLPAMVDQAKTATTQAFALQKAQDQLESSGLSSASGTDAVPADAATGASSTADSEASSNSSTTAPAVPEAVQPEGGASQ
jgi:hypothetical protein